MYPTAYGIFVASGPAMYAQNLQVIALIIMVEFHTRPDNSSVTDFDSYEPVWYFDEVASFPEPKWKMARCLGEAYDIGQAMCYFILSESGIPIAISTVQQRKLVKPHLVTVISQIIFTERVMKTTTLKHPNSTLLKSLCQKRMIMITRHLTSKLEQK
jgi:hypothetical protein